MSAAIGDVVASFGLDGRKWFEESVAIQNSAKQLGQNVSASLKGALAVDTLSSGVTRGLTGAASTAAAGLQTTLSTRFGALGNAVGIVAGIAIVDGIKSLINEKDAFAGISETVATTNRELDGFIQRQSRIADFSLKIDSLTSIKDADALDKSLNSQINAARDRVSSIQEQERNVTAEIRKTERARDDSRFFGEGLARRLGIAVPADQLDAQIEKLQAQRSELRAGLRGAGADLGALEEQRRLLDENRGNIEEQQKKAEADRIREANPDFQSRLSQLERINELVVGGNLERSVGVVAGQRILADFQRTLPQPDAGRPNTGNVLGTSSAFSALQASLRQDKSQEALTDVNRQQLQKLEEILRAIQGNQAPPGEEI